MDVLARRRAHPIMISRRSVLKSASLAAAAAVSRPALAGFAGTGEPPREALQQLDYSAVTLLPGPAQQQFDRNHQFFLAIDNDKLLKPFRERTGLPAPGEDMGGWYSNSLLFDPHGSFDGFVPGHSFGQYLSALARDYAITGDAATQAKVRALVLGVTPTLQSRFYDGYTLPAYTFDKMCCGLMDAYTFGHIPEALPALRQALTAALPHLPEKALSRPEMRARPHTSDAQTWDESYTLPENLFLAFQRTGDTRFRDTAARFLEDDAYFNPLAEDINVLPGEHAYSHVNALSSAMQAYLTLGSEKHLRAATNGFRMVRDQSFATGGWGPGEAFVQPATDDLARSLLTQAASFETPCGAYGHFKIARYLLRVTGDPVYGDSMERVLYNTVLGARPILADGSSFYYSDFSNTGRKTYARDKWPCCSGTLPQIAADYGISTYLLDTSRNRGGLVVNLFLPSRVRWQQEGVPVTLTQETLYPFTPTTRMTVTADREREFTIAVRIPAWAGPATRVLINGKPASGELRPASFFPVRRSFRNNDTIEVSFDMPSRIETLDLLAPQPHQLGALLRGPVVFMATGSWPTELSRAQLLAAQANPAGDRLTVASPGGPTLFTPYMHIDDETYRTYQLLTT